MVVCFNKVSYISPQKFTFSFLSQSSHTKVGNTVRLPLPRIPNGKPGQAPLLSASLSGSPSWSISCPL